MAILFSDGGRVNLDYLRENNVELIQDTLNFYLKDHKDLYNSMSACIGRNNVLKNLVSIYQKLESFF